MTPTPLPTRAPTWPKPLLMCALLVGAPAAASNTPDDRTTAAATDGTSGSGDDGRSWMVLPGAFYSQETSVGFAAYGSATFPLRGTGDETWPSSLSAAAVYTLRNQVSLAVWPTLYLGQDNDWVLSGELIGSHYPTRYYGLGADADAVWQDYTRRWLKTDVLVLRRLAGPLYAGVVHGFSATQLRDIGAPTDGAGAAEWRGSDALGEGRVTGESGGVVHGAGLAVRHERRDNDQSTRRGTLLEARGRGHASWLGSDQTYGELVVDGRAFHTFGSDWTIAAQWLTELRRGDVPFTHMAELGGDDILRGMYEGRYRDRSLTAVQGELRFPIVWRFRGVAFAGAGQTFSGSDTLLAQAPHWTAGGGLRFELDELSHSTIRLDVGAGPSGTGFILNFGEAF